MDSEQLNRFSAVARLLLRDHKLKTPFLMLDESEIQRSLARFKKYLPKVRLFYAAKANPDANLIKYLVDEGLSLDVASEGEIFSALSLQVPAHKLFLSTPVKTSGTINSMLKHGVYACAVDSSGELERIAACAKSIACTRLPVIFIRIRIESKHVEVDLNTKFGCSLNEALDIVQRAMELDFTIGGICFHVGTQSCDADNYFLGIETAMLIAREASRRFGARLPIINIGGGFCDEQTAARNNLSLDEFYAKVGKACEEATNAGFEVYAEPGRCLVSSAGALVTSVLGTNIRDSQPWAYLDDGIYGCYSIKLYENQNFQFHPLMPVRRARSLRTRATANKQKQSWVIAGPTCDSLDVIANDVELPNTLSPGDLLISPNLGAYTVSTACSFNGFSPPVCHLVRSSIKSKKLTASLLKVYSEPGRQIAANA